MGSKRTPKNTRPRHFALSDLPIKDARRVKGGGKKSKSWYEALARALGTSIADQAGH
jgi:hypothetical protein